MKIYFYTYPVAFQCPGGGEIQLLKSKEALERRGHEVVLFNQWEHDLADADVVHQFSVQGGFYNLVAYLHSHDIPLVLSPILWLSDNTEQYAMGEIGYMLSASDVICPNSQAEVDRFLGHFDLPEERYCVTHNGVDSVFFEQVEPDAFCRTFDINSGFILCVGNVEPRKNQISLVEAAKLVGLEVVLIGDVRDEDYYQTLCRRSEGHFKYVGHIDHSDPLLRSAYAACGVFALPSLLETPGLAALEAAAAGVPLVITKEGCAKEYFGDHAFYVNPTDIEEISESLVKAMVQASDPELLKTRVREFSWDRVAEELEAAYEKARA
ncbi:glycosyltransferase [Pseudomaricurvus sp. HS19]|uniref:glycosyltransferase n=1 Tax=Pseudomaricurvus sp. HS19 TaxID=2692626 RepID=UPI00136AFED4|nr:glycosyltransferase [Pseudomaricurvus sp. HS19]MYM62870.1 glycosyltransferase [Pseudomaricurvus sp. HS19]